MDPAGTRCGMRTNYSCGSLQAAEQLEALMQQRAPGVGACCSMMLGGSAEPQNLSNCALNVKCGDANSGGFLGAAPPHTGVDPVACNVPLGGGDGFSQALERMDFSTGGLMPLMRGAAEPPQQRPATMVGDFGQALSVPFGMAPNQHPMHSVASPLSML